MTRQRLLASAALLLTAATLTIAGCSTGTGTTNNSGAGSAPANNVPTASPTTAASPAPSPTGTYRDQIIAWGRRFAACARAHGLPTFPDPVYPADWGPNGPNNGNELFPDNYPGINLFLDRNASNKAVVGQAADACIDISRQEPPAPDSLRPPTARELAIMRQFSQCMRRHGFSSFPDPRSDGTFPIQGGPYDSLLPYHTGGSTRLTNAYLACEQDHMPVLATR